MLEKVFLKHARQKKVTKYFKDDLRYAFDDLELNPYEDSWLGYLITQNGYEDDKYREEKYPMSIDYKLKLKNYQLLTPHHIEGNQLKIQVKHLYFDEAADLVILRCTSNDARSVAIERRIHLRRVTEEELRQRVELKRKTVHGRDRDHPKGLYSTKDIIYNQHYGKLIGNETTDHYIVLTVLTSNVQNLVSVYGAPKDGKSNSGSFQDRNFVNFDLFKTRLEPGTKAFCMFKPISFESASALSQTIFVNKKIRIQ